MTSAAQDIVVASPTLVGEQDSRQNRLARPIYYQSNESLTRPKINYISFSFVRIMIEKELETSFQWLNSLILNEYVRCCRQVQSIEDMAMRKNALVFAH
jgi:hypothetical protein